MEKIWPKSSVELFCFILDYVVFSDFSLGETESPSFHDLGIFGRVHDSQNRTIFIFGRTRTLQIVQEQSGITLEKNIFGTSKQFKHTFSLNLWKRRAPANHEVPSHKFLNILNMGSISSRKPEMEFW